MSHAAGCHFGHNRQQQARPVGRQRCRKVNTTEFAVRRPHAQCTASRVCAHSTENPTQGSSFKQSSEWHVQDAKANMRTQALHPVPHDHVSVQLCLYGHVLQCAHGHQPLTLNPTCVDTLTSRQALCAGLSAAPLPHGNPARCLSCCCHSAAGPDRRSSRKQQRLWQYALQEATPGI